MTLDGTSFKLVVDECYQQSSELNHKANPHDSQGPQNCVTVNQLMDTM